jgi:hypothetical protein
MRSGSSLDAQWPDLVATISEAIDLEATARSSGALVRRREIRSAEGLLRLALAYGPGGLSLRSAAAWAGLGGPANLSDTAVMERPCHAADWLGEVAGALLRRAAAADAAPRVLPGRRLRIADAGVITRPGSTGPDWRLHALYGPAAGRSRALEPTDGRGAEGFGRAGFAPGEVAMGDRAHARPPALRRSLDGGADFIVRTGWTRLRLLDGSGAPLDREAVFDPPAPGEPAERAVSAVRAGARGEGRGKPLFQARLIVLRLSPRAAARAAEAPHRRRSRCRAGKAPQPLTVRATGYPMLPTSLPAEVPAAEVLAAYRLRRQVELASKRLKSLLGLDRLPAKSERLARTRLLARLILAPLIDGASQDLLDSPPAADAAPRRPVSPWRIAHVPRDTPLAAIRGVLTIAAPRGAHLLARHLRERPRQRASQFLASRRHPSLY